MRSPRFCPHCKTGTQLDAYNMVYCPKCGWKAEKVREGLPFYSIFVSPMMTVMDNRRKKKEIHATV